MNTQALIGLIKQALPVVVGGLIAAAPVVFATCVGAKAVWNQSIHDQRVAAVRSISYACTRTVQLAGRLAVLYETADRAPRSDRMQRRLAADFDNLSRDMQDARTTFVAELNLSNALFDTDFRMPVEDAPPPADQIELTPERRRQILDTLRVAIPVRSRECATITQNLMSKLRS
ncbi:MAG TPA: hypothetical protein VNJ06_16210 [Gemmatimonadales bacterium]|nr:MAG: hypothetical protein DMG80_14265 [Acidobacteriota bacterium]HXG98650.1 hypothetical protein [Gemmatimonadales bacterium]